MVAEPDADADERAVAVAVPCSDGFAPGVGAAAGVEVVAGNDAADVVASLPWRAAQSAVASTTTTAHNSVIRRASTASVWPVVRIWPLVKGGRSCASSAST